MIMFIFLKLPVVEVLFVFIKYLIFMKIYLYKERKLDEGNDG